MISVYHLSDSASRKLRRFGPKAELVEQATQLWSQRQYALVADVIGTEDLETGFALTNSVDRPWWQNAQVTPRFPGFPIGQGCRSTSCGDLLVNDAGAFVVCTFGFEEVPVPAHPTPTGEPT